MKIFRRNKCWTKNVLRIVILLIGAFSIVRLWQNSSNQALLFMDASILLSPRVTKRLQFATPCDSRSCPLPHWMQNYFFWHRTTIDQVTQTSSQWSEQRLLVMRCLDNDRCGGTADRLKSLPLYLAVAAKTQRLFFLRWTRPFRLENFMIPGGSINWTVPETLVSLLDGNVSKTVLGAQALPQLVRAAHKRSIWLVEAAAQMAGNDLFQQVVSQLEDTPVIPISTFFHEMFLTMFHPAPALRSLVEHQMDALDLYPNQFVTAHIRAKYPGEPYRETWNVTLLQHTVTNAIDCASSLAESSLPIYVASDTLLTLQIAQQYRNNSTSTSKVRVVSHLDANTLPHQDPPHLNFAKEEDPSAFFSIFADLFIMSQSHCVAFGAGGFGRFGSLVSFNASCHVAHSIRGKLNNCSSI